jgi:RNA polymerase sigma factor (sigma-70 family)
MAGFAWSCSSLPGRELVRIRYVEENRASIHTGNRGVQELPDEALLEGFAAGDRRSGARFVQKFGPRVYSVALLITRDRRDAEEVAQDAFVRAWRYAASFDARRGTVVAWLLGITRNLAMDRTRVTSRRPEQLLTQPPVDIPADGIGPEEAADRDDALTWIAEQLRALPPGQREALLAASLHGLTTREIAESSGVPIGTVKTRIRAALRRIRERVPERVECET